MIDGFKNALGFFKQHLANFFFWIDWKIFLVTKTQWTIWKYLTFEILQSGLSLHQRKKEDSLGCLSFLFEVNVTK